MYCRVGRRSSLPVGGSPAHEVHTSGRLASSSRTLGLVVTYRKLFLKPALLSGAAATSLQAHRGGSSPPKHTVPVPEARLFGAEWGMLSIAPTMRSTLGPRRTPQQMARSDERREPSLFPAFNAYQADATYQFCVARWVQGRCDWTIRSTPCLWSWHQAGAGSLGAREFVYFAL